MMNEYTIQGESMRRMRIRAGLSIGALSRVSGVSRETISALERSVNRSGTIYTISRLADALEISIDEYVGHEVTENVN